MPFRSSPKEEESMNILPRRNIYLVLKSVQLPCAKISIFFDIAIIRSVFSCDESPSHREEGVSN
jgi:hypothetical protein